MRPKEEWIDVNGKHEGLVSMETFQKAQEILKGRYHVPYQLKSGITNPLAGIIKCGHCGASMVYRPYTKQAPHIKCHRQPRCQSKASNFALVETKLLNGLQDWLDNYKAHWDQHQEPKLENHINEVEIKKSALSSLNRELEELELQKGNIFDLLERKIYNENTFLERSATLADRIENTKIAIKNMEKELETEIQRQQAQKDIIPKVERVLELYHKTEDPKKKNALLKSVLEKAVYKKEKHQFRDDFELTLYPKIPNKGYNNG